MNGALGDGNANNQTGNQGNASGSTSGGGNQTLGLGTGDFTDQFATDADIDWMTNFASADGLDVFGLYLENIGDENEGEVGIA